MAYRKEGGSFLLFKIRLRVIHKKRKRGKEERREGKKKKRREERRKGKEDRRYVNYVCIELFKFRMEKYRFLYNSMDLSSFGIEIIDIWFGTLYLMYGLGLETPKLISC